MKRDPLRRLMNLIDLTLKGQTVEELCRLRTQFRQQIPSEDERLRMVCAELDERNRMLLEEGKEALIRAMRNCGYSSEEIMELLHELNTVTEEQEED